MEITQEMLNELLGYKERADLLAKLSEIHPQAKKAMGDLSAQNLIAQLNYRTLILVNIGLCHPESPSLFVDSMANIGIMLIHLAGEMKIDLLGSMIRLAAIAAESERMREVLDKMAAEDAAGKVNGQRPS